MINSALYSKGWSNDSKLIRQRQINNFSESLPKNFDWRTRLQHTQLMSLVRNLGSSIDKLLKSVVNSLTEMGSNNNESQSSSQ